jgi:trans-2,3-dihydro-3-hydroxyanthranilate isomerase
VFEEDAGLVTVSILSERGAVVGAELRAPRPLTRGPVLGIPAAAACLSLDPADIATGTHSPEVLSVGLAFLVVELGSRDALRRARANLAQHEHHLPPLGVDAVYAYFAEVPGTDVSPSVIHARTFAPLDGVPEDSATGSATAATIALRAQLDQNALGVRRWRFHQGVDMGRPSILLGRTVPGRTELPLEIYVAGGCVPMMAGSFVLPLDD